MALLKSWNDKTSKDTIPNAYIYAIETNFNMLTMNARIVFGIWRSVEDAQAGVQPFDTFTYNLYPAGKPTIYEKDESGNDTEVVVTPSFPSFPELIQANIQAWYLIGQAIDNLAVSQPEFKNAYIIPMEGT